MYPMTHDISIKELRENLADIADSVEQGKTYRVIRRSKPAFIIMKVDADATEGEWETVVDFTDGGKTMGVPLKEVLKALKEMRS